MIRRDELQLIIKLYHYRLTLEKKKLVGSEVNSLMYYIFNVFKLNSRNEGNTLAFAVNFHLSISNLYHTTH